MVLLRCRGRSSRVFEVPALKREKNRHFIFLLEMRERERETEGDLRETESV